PVRLSSAASPARHGGAIRVAETSSSQLCPAFPLRRSLPRHPSTIPRAIPPSSRSLFRITRLLLLFLLGPRRTAEGRADIFSPSLPPRVPDGAARPVIAPRHFVFAVDRPDGNSD
ncbi:unnamed protein product, partial [Ixodes pacificus]